MCSKDVEPSAVPLAPQRRRFAFPGKLRNLPGRGAALSSSTPTPTPPQVLPRLSPQGCSWSVIFVDLDAHNRNRQTLCSLLPRESRSHVRGPPRRVPPSPPLPHGAFPPDTLSDTPVAGVCGFSVAVICGSVFREHPKRNDLMIYK